VLDERPAECDVEHLAAAADAEYRQGTLDGLVCQLDLGHVALGVDAADVVGGVLVSWEGCSP